MRKRALVVVFGLVVAIVGSESPAVASPGRAEGKLVMVGANLRWDTGEDKDGLYVVNADGSGLRQVTDSIQDSQPRWSPDGNWIVFAHDGSAGHFRRRAPGWFGSPRPRRWFRL